MGGWAPAPGTFKTRGSAFDYDIGLQLVNRPKKGDDEFTLGGSRIHKRIIDTLEFYP
jgi:hypothetical protein